MVDQLRSHRLYILMFALNFAVLIGVIYLLRRPEARVIAITTPGPHVTIPGPPIKVQVSGAILEPGVYSLDAGSRVSDALDAAGGARADANLDDLNLALKLEDGDGILVPTRVPGIESPPWTPISSDSTKVATPKSKININTATIEQLDTLPRIGPTLAQRIVDYRAQNGPFERIEDIKNVSGIGDVLFNDMKALITVQ
jgi:competence protein ComEA